jgi:site-specific recombinase XerD
LRRELVGRWGARSVHEVTRRNIIELVSEIVDRGAPVAANQTLKVAKTFFGWCVGTAILERSPCEGVKPPTRETARDRVLTDDELARVIWAAREIGGAFGGIVELLALTAQRRDEVAGMAWDELDLDDRMWSLSGARTKNGKPHLVLQGWRLHDLRRTAVSGMARLGAAPHVADKILNHTAGTIAGVAAVYQRHEFMTERKAALVLWSEHIQTLLTPRSERSPTQCRL